MFIPKGVNQELFYREARKKGIQIRSRFTGVFPFIGRVNNSEDTRMYWLAATGAEKGDPKYMKKFFPFTELGERSAALAVENQHIEQNIKRIKPKRRDESNISNSSVNTNIIDNCSINIS